MKFLLFTTFLVLCFSTTVKAEYIFNESFEYHSIDEPDPKELLSTISRTLKKKCKTHGRLLACTSGSVQIKPTYTELKKGKCGLSSLKFTASAIYNIPTWKQKGSASPEIQKKWETLINDTILHEKHHGEIRNKYMKKAHNMILKLETRCNKIHRATNRIFDKMGLKEDNENRKFDSRDSHTPTTFPN